MHSNGGGSAAEEPLVGVWVKEFHSRGARRTLVPKTGLVLRYWGDGSTAFGLGPEQAARILRWSEAAAAHKAARNQGLRSTPVHQP
jgi:hypothetical protein